MHFRSALFEYKDEIAAIHAKGAFLDTDHAIQGELAPLHFGAMKYYYEIGVLD